MEIQSSAFYNTSMKLSLKDIINLFLGRKIKESSYIIGLWKMPDNNCPCENCRKRFGTGIKWIDKLKGK